MIKLTLSRDVRHAATLLAKLENETCLRHLFLDFIVILKDLTETFFQFRGGYVSVQVHIKLAEQLVQLVLVDSGEISFLYTKSLWCRPLLANQCHLQLSVPCKLHLSRMHRGTFNLFWMPLGL